MLGFVLLLGLVNAALASSDNPSFLLAVLGVRPERWNFVRKQIAYIKGTTKNSKIKFHCSVSFFDVDFYETNFLNKKPLGCAYQYVPGKYPHQMLGVRNVDSYDFVGAMLDDVDAKPTNGPSDFRIPYFIDVMNKFHFDVASPSLVNYGIKDKQHMTSQPKCVAREVLILDHLLSVFRNDAFLCLQSQLQSAIDINYYGWTYVPMLTYTCHCKFGVVDQQLAEHMLKDLQNMKLAAMQKDFYLEHIFPNTTREARKAFYNRRHELDRMALEKGCQGMRDITDDSFLLLNMSHPLKLTSSSSFPSSSLAQAASCGSCQTHMVIIISLLLVVAFLIARISGLQQSIENHDE